MGTEVRLAALGRVEEIFEFLQMEGKRHLTFTFLFLSMRISKPEQRKIDPRR